MAVFLTANLKHPPSAAYCIDCGVPVWAIKPRTLRHWNGNAYIWDMISWSPLHIEILSEGQ